MSGSKITRVKKEKDFVQIDKFPLQDSRLSWRAKGLLAYMLSMPDDWQFYVNELHKHAKDGKDSTRSALKELEEFGYLVIEKNNRSEKGKFATNNYFLHERPLTDTGDPQRVSRHGQTATTNNNKTKNNSTNNNREREKENSSPQNLEVKESLDNLEPVKNKTGIPSPEYPVSFTQELITACEAWFEYRKQIGYPFSNVFAKQSRVSGWSAEVAEYGENIVIASIYEAISQDWRKTYPKPNTDKKYFKKSKQPKQAKKREVDGVLMSKLDGLKSRGVITYKRMEEILSWDSDEEISKEVDKLMQKPM